MNRQRSYYIKKYPNTNVAGFEEVMTNLNKAISKMKGDVERGMVNAAFMIRGETEKTSPATPLDYSNLRASWFITYSKGASKDPLAFSGHFRNNPRRKITASQFSGWHKAAIAEASVMSAINPRKATVVMGYSANYAMWVHEMIGANFTDRDPEAGPKWFQEAMDRNQGRILEIIAKTSIIKK